MADYRFLPENELSGFVGELGADRTLVNARGEDETRWRPFSDIDVDYLSSGLLWERPVSPVKSVFLPARELVARYGSAAEGDPLDEISGHTLAVVGLRGCECRALAYLDKVMYDEPCPEVFYKVRRENTIIVSVDCEAPAVSCFCELLGEHPYPEAGFDINLSPIDDGYIVEAGSERGEELLDRLDAHLSEPSQDQLDERDVMREDCYEALEAQNYEYSIPDDIHTSLPEAIDAEFWQDELSRCVQCGGCTAVCPTCYCFLLADREAGNDLYERMRSWDSCQLSGYSEMAGPTGNEPDPRRSHMSKFQHRFCHKFWYDPTNWEMFGCVGCGRCGQTCPGEIDMRQVLTRINAERVENA